MRAFLNVGMGLALILGFASCATTSKYEAKVYSWEGADAHLLVKVWGKPDAVETLHTGHKMFVYAWMRHAPIGYYDARTQRTLASTGNDPMPAMPSKPSAQCATFFEVDQKDVITKVQYRGDDCKSRE